MTIPPFEIPFHMRPTPGEMFEDMVLSQDLPSMPSRLRLSVDEYCDFKAGKLRMTPELAQDLATITQSKADYWWGLEASFLEAIPQLKSASPALLDCLESSDKALARHFLGEQVRRLIGLGLLLEAANLITDPRWRKGLEDD